MLVDKVHQLLVVNVAGSHNDHVFAKVIALMEVDDHFAVDLTNVVNVTKDGLSHHVLTIDVEVDVLHESFLRVLVCRF